MSQGWIKFYRSFRKWEWRDCPNTVCLFVNLLIEVSYEPSKYRGLEIPAGSGVFGREKLAVMTGLSIQGVRTSLARLESTNEITIKTSNQFSIISITNWEKYQGDNQQINQQSTNQQPTNNQPTTTSKEDKNIRKEEKKEHAVVKTRSINLEFETEFWPMYPHKVGKPTAQKAYANARTRAEKQPILDGLERYKANKPQDRNWCNPSTFLNQDRWGDEPDDQAHKRPEKNWRKAEFDAAKEATRKDFQQWNRPTMNQPTPSYLLESETKKT